MLYPALLKFRSGALAAVAVAAIAVASSCSNTPTAPSPDTQPGTQTPNPDPSGGSSPRLASLALAAEEVDGGASVSGTLTLSAAAPAAGFAVALASSDDAAAVPASITIAAGTTSGTFAVTTEAVGLEKDVTITATAAGVSRTAALNIEPGAGDGPILAFTSTSDDIVSGDKMSGSVRLSEPAPAGGLRLTLSSSDAAVEVPASLTLPAGTTRGSFEIATHPVAVDTHVTITLSTSATVRARGLRVRPVAGESRTTLVITLLATQQGDDDPSAEAPTLSSVTPNTGAQDSTVAVTLAGTHFADGATVAVSGAGVTVSNVTVASATSLTASLAVSASAAAGARNVTVTTEGGTSAAGTFMITALPPSAPSLATVSPDEGVRGTTVAVTLTGTTFIDGATVAVSGDGVTVSDVSVASATKITADFVIGAAAAAGARNVTVTTEGGTSGAETFTILLPDPTLTTVSPASGTTVGGTSVTLTGTNLTGATGVTFDGVAATDVAVVDDTSVTATTPSHAAGAVDVVVTTPGGTATLTDAFTYITLPSLTAVTATSGSASGGVGVTLTGTLLSGTTSVTFGGIAATSVNVVNSTTVTAVTPAHSAGAVDVVITATDGSATLASGFTYDATAVGQAAHGGKIAALNGGLNNLIAAEADNDAAIPWGGSGTAIGAGARSSTDGAANTVAIVNELTGNQSIPIESYAAGVCSAYEVDSQGNTPCQAGNTCYDDWFLPAGGNITSSGQLNALFVNRAAVGGFAASLYWSSTEHSAAPTAAAFFQDFSTGSQGARLKSTNGRIRCERAFTPG